MKPVPLVVIDMQEHYGMANNNILLRNIVRHVKKAKESNAPIVVVEYVGMGKTSQTIMRELENYPNMTTVHKNKSDGSRQVEQALADKFGIKSGRVKTCGIFSHDCVEKTSMGLLHKGFKVHVIEEACGAGQSWHDNAMIRLDKTPNAKVIYWGGKYRSPGGWE